MGSHKVHTFGTWTDLRPDDGWIYFTKFANFVNYTGSHTLLVPGLISLRPDDGWMYCTTETCCPDLM